MLLSELWNQIQFLYVPELFVCTLHDAIMNVLMALGVTTQECILSLTICFDRLLSFEYVSQTFHIVINHIHSVLSVPCLKLKSLVCKKVLLLFSVEPHYC